jgi:KaiC/GvpD/RAD55 family RecA-like ATPase
LTDAARLSTGVAGLDQLLGGGLVPGTLTVLLGATGIGKTQLGLQFANAGASQEGRRGVIFDMTYRGDSQSHADYARRMFDWRLTSLDPRHPAAPRDVFEEPALGEYLHVFDYRGRRLSDRDLAFDAQRAWQQELLSKLRRTIAFFYGHFVRGVRRVVIDGIDPADQPREAMQFELLEYIYHQILRKDAEWVARDLFRQDFRQNAERVAQHPYDHRGIGCLMLYTAAESMLDQLIDRPLTEGDWLANANTVIYLGRIREGTRIGRAMYIAKHRGSACADRIIPYRIDERGITLL